MEKIRILLVSNGFYPEISPRSFRATELAKEFCRQGHSVTVITKFRDHQYSGFLNEFNISLRMWNGPKFPRIPVSGNLFFSKIFKGFARILSILIEYPGIEEMFLVKKILKHESGYDLMVSFAVPFPVHWGVAWSRTGSHKVATKWVADCGDPYMGDVLDSFRKPFYFKYLEKYFCRKADFITIPVESARPAYYSEFHHKIRIIPQGFDFDLNANEKTQNITGIPEFAYAGKFLKGIRDPGALLDCLSKIDSPFKFHVFTDQPELLDAYREALDGKLLISSYISREELMKQLTQMDFLINFDNDTPLNVPSKLIDYAITNRPVLNINRTFNSETLFAFLNGDYRSRMLLPNPQQYHISKISSLFMELLQAGS